jgi:hypothetical protein
MGCDPSIGEYERLLLSMKTTARKELILLHPDRSVVAGSTREWLKVPFILHTNICRSIVCFRIGLGSINTFMWSFPCVQGHDCLTYSETLICRA